MPDSDANSSWDEFLVQHPDQMQTHVPSQPTVGDTEFADELASYFSAEQKSVGPTESADTPSKPSQASNPNPPSKNATALTNWSPDNSGEGTSQAFGNDYELLEEVAVGGTGPVYKARQISQNRIVALKMILSGQHAGKKDVRRFYAEVKTAAKLQHAGIVPIYEAGEHDGQHYLAMGFVDGPTLAEVIKNGPLPPRQAALYTKKLASALRFAHERRVLHRDLKPANVLLDQQSKPHVRDFGLAKKVEWDRGLTATGQILGTPSYMAPEMTSGTIDQSADVYSLGAIFYALLTGRPPFQADNPVDTVVQVLEQEPAEPRLLNSRIPRDLETICLKCLRKKPRARYQTAKEVSDELRRFLKGQRLGTRPSGPLAQGWRACKRKPVVAAVLAVTVGVLLAVTWLMTMLIISVDPPILGPIQGRQPIANLTPGSVTSNSPATDNSPAAPLVQQRSNDMQRSLARAESELYAMRIATAAQAIRNGHIGRARILLRDCPGNLRAWEHAYLWGLCDKKVQPINLPSASGDVVFGPHGRYAAYTDKPNSSVRLWDLLTNVQITAFALPARARLLELSADGRWLFYVVPNPDTGSPEVCLRDLQAERLLQVHGATAAAISLDSQRFAIAKRDGSVLIHRLKGPSSILKDDVASGGVVLSLAFDTANRRLATANTQGTVDLWDLSSRKRIQRLRGHEGAVSTLAFGHHNRWLATAGHDSTVRIWDLAAGDTRLIFRDHKSQVNTVAFGPRGRQLATCGNDRQVILWDAESGRQLQLQNHSTSVHKLVFNQAGTRLLSAGFSVKRQAAEVHLWDLAEDEPQQIRLDEPIRSSSITSRAASGVPFGSDGQLLTHSESEPLERTNAELAAILSDEQASQAAYSTDGRLFAAVVSDPTDSAQPNSIQVWDLFEERLLTTLPVAEDAKPTMVFASDGRMLITATGEHLRNEAATISVWDVRGWDRVRSLEGHTDGVIALSVSADGRWLASSGSDRTILLWDLPAGQLVHTLEGHKRPVSQLAFSPGGDFLASGGKDRVIKVWRLSDGRLHLNLHASPVRGLCFNWDGRRLLSSGGRGPVDTIKIWDADAGHELLELVDLHRTRSLVTSPNGQQIVSIGKQGQVSIWDAPETLEVLATEPFHDTPVESAKKPTGEIAANSDAVDLSEIRSHRQTVPHRVEERADDEGPRSDRLNRIGAAMLNFHQQHHAFPAALNADSAGNPLLSWRVLLLPFLGPQDVIRAVSARRTLGQRAQQDVD